MRASPIATPMTMPATVPLASRCGDGVDGPLVVCVLEELLVVLLGVVLLGVWMVDGELSLVVDSRPGVVRAAEAGAILLTGGLEVGDAGELVELLPIPETAGPEEAVGIELPSLGAGVPKNIPPVWVSSTPFSEV